jgi:hypothetical protein
MTSTVLSEVCELTIEQLDSVVGGASIKFSPEYTRWAKGGSQEGIEQQTVDLLMKAMGA